LSQGLSSLSRRLPLVAAALLAGSVPLLSGLAHQGAATGILDREAIDALIAPATRFDAAEPGEDRPGGAATSRNPAINANAFSHASGNIEFKKEFDFKIGNAVFRKQWVSAPASTKSSDGLGPLYNARACQNCHLKDGRGHPPAANWPEEDAVSFLMRLSIPPQTEEDKRLLAEMRIKSVDDPVYGGQLQTLSIQGHEAEGKIRIDYRDVPVTLAGGEVVHLRKPEYRIEHLGYGPLDPRVMLSPRVAPQMIGLGLVELVPEAQILEYADPDDKDGDGISGKAQRVWSLEENRVMLGRFGYKGGAPSLSQQAAMAFNGDIGISSPLIPHDAGDCTPKEPLCLGAPHGSDPATGEREVGEKLFKLVSFYTRNLAVPARRTPGDPQILKGKSLFYAAGCASCHRPKFMTGPSEEQPHLAHQLIWPYADFLLHDMGEGLADNAPEGLADGREWRTPPLWGIGLTQIVNGKANFLHDGRARTLTEAVLWHGGEAQKARDAFADFAPEDRAALLAFLNSL
jgi:CxxC motif-containing protein (DUF1111 family)